MILPLMVMGLKTCLEPFQGIWLCGWALSVAILYWQLKVHINETSYSTKYFNLMILIMLTILTNNSHPSQIDFGHWRWFWYHNVSWSNIYYVGFLLDSVIIVYVFTSFRLCLYPDSSLIFVYNVTCHPCNRTSDQNASRGGSSHTRRVTVPYNITMYMILLYINENATVEFSNSFSSRQNSVNAQGFSSVYLRRIFQLSDF